MAERMSTNSQTEGLVVKRRVSNDRHARTRIRWSVATAFLLVAAVLSAAFAAGNRSALVHPVNAADQKSAGPGDSSRIGSQRGHTSYKVKQLKAISGPSPFVAGCPGGLFDSTNITGHELEPAIAVNPANPRNIVATWKQDVGPDSTRSDLVAFSLNNGRTWHRRTLPGLTTCTGGTADTGSDPWVSAGGDGTVYFSGLAADQSTDPPMTAVVAGHSKDGGRTWPALSTVAAPLAGNETDAITGSPTRPRHAYMTWANFEINPPRVNTVEFSRTTNNGATWSHPVLVDQPGEFQLDLAPKIHVLPNGTLVCVFARADLETGLGTLQAARSVDGGRTWLPAVEAGSKPVVTSTDPETGEQLPSPGYPSSAVAPDGTLYIAFEDSRSPTSGAIGVARSRDGGQTWMQMNLPGVSSYAFEPAIAVNRHGTVGVIWYDLRNDVPGDGSLSADVWFAHSANRGRTWTQTHVAGPTDLRTAPLPGHNYVGEYQGLAALGDRDFAASFTLASPYAKNGPTDIFFARIGPRNERQHSTCHGCKH